MLYKNELLGMHENPNPDCPVGRHIQNTIEPIFSAAQLAMEKVLCNVMLEDVVKDIGKKLNIDC